MISQSGVGITRIDASFLLDSNTPDILQGFGYDTEELKLPNDAAGYVVSCKQCKTIVGIVQEK